MSDHENEPKTPRRGTRVRKSTVKAAEFEEVRRKLSQTELSDHDDEFSGEEVQIHDTVSSVTALPGKEIYSFNKVKKHERVIVPEKTSVPKTPHKLRKKMGKEIKTMDLSSEDEFFQESESSYTCSDSEESSESEVQAESDSEKEENVRTLTRNSRRIQSGVKQSAKNHKYTIKTEEYFSNNAIKKSSTSNHTLDQLQTPRLSQDQLQKLLAKSKISANHRDSVKEFAESARGSFNKWICLLHENFNLLLYGLGTKKNILNEFHVEMLKDLPVIVVNGFFPSLTLKDILDGITQDLLQVKENPANPFDACDVIEREFELIPDQHLYLIVHNIEGEMLRNNKSQSVLARLASIKNLHLIASIDHINAPLVWNHNKLSKFNFIWWDVTSFLSYTDETSFESSMMVQRTGNLALSSLRNVFLSLTSNSKGIYLIILKYQLEHQSQYYQERTGNLALSSLRNVFLSLTSNSKGIYLIILKYQLEHQSQYYQERTGNLALSSLRNVFLSLTSNSKGIYLIILMYQLEHQSQYYQGLLFKDLYWSCREAFLVSSDLALRAQLTEFVDHKMVKIRRSADGAEYLIIPITNSLLQRFLNEQSS